MYAALYHTVTSFICGHIVTKLDMKLKVAGYDICTVEKYQWDRSKVKAKVTYIVKNT